MYTHDRIYAVEVSLQRNNNAQSTELSGTPTCMSISSALPHETANYACKCATKPPMKNIMLGSKHAWVNFEQLDFASAASEAGIGCVAATCCASSRSRLSTPNC